MATQEFMKLLFRNEQAVMKIREYGVFPVNDKYVVVNLETFEYVGSGDTLSDCVEVSLHEINC